MKTKRPAPKRKTPNTAKPPRSLAAAPCSPLARLIRRRKVRFWGAEHIITPRLLNHVEGDGKLIIFVTPLATRPQHYVLRVDSKWANGDLSDAAWHDHIDEICGDLEDGFGRAADEYEHDNGRTYHKHNPWPALNDSCGLTWGILAKLPKADLRTEAEIRTSMRRANMYSASKTGLESDILKLDNTVNRLQYRPGFEGNRLQPGDNAADMGHG
jgi:hypothetical protein